jgi:uncharacterized protein YdaU (DUF1376 family)
MLANINFRQMPLAARGLLYTLRLECWENHRLPSDSKKLANVLRFDEEEITSAMHWLDAFLKTNDGWLTSPDLEDYRKHLVDQKTAQSLGGKKGAAITNASKTRVPRESVVKLNTGQVSPEKVSPVTNKDELLHRSWEEFKQER